MKKISILALLSALISGCAPFGETGFMSAGLPLYGRPTVWVIHPEIRGVVFDYDSCNVTYHESERLFTMSLVTAKRIPGARVTLRIPDYPDTKEKYVYTIRTDENGDFIFKRRTSFRLYGYEDSYRNQESRGEVTIEAEGYAPLVASAWPGDAFYGQSHNPVEIGPGEPKRLFMIMDVGDYAE